MALHFIVADARAVRAGVYVIWVLHLSRELNVIILWAVVSDAQSSKGYGETTYSKFANFDIVDTKNFFFLCGSEFEGSNPLSEEV